ncbi:heparinase II/III family protein [Paenibacillus sp. 1011MAR3C5]|uniref:heparinase II/III domain-containing protein n=1 Tax=Paenibacillus sp. 1011MAR3C5 TaxID=1675787 RepID=UPI0016026D37|nr:heparinase II/III family protein [Paenibacillus sp. 1011MAR3C5]
MKKQPAAIAGIEVLAVRYLETGERAAVHIHAHDANGGFIAAIPPQDVMISVSDSTILQVEGDAIIGAGLGEADVTVTVSMEDGRSFGTCFAVGVIPGARAYISQLIDHPRILFTAEERRTLQSRIAFQEHNVFGINVPAIWEELRKEGDRYAEESGFRVTYANAPDVIDVVYPLLQPDPLPNPPGYVDYPFWTMYSRGIEHRLITLSLLYALTEERGYADKAKAMLLDLAAYRRWYEFPARGAEGNLSNAHFTLGAATAYDTLYGMLTIEEREIIRTSILEKGLRPLAIDFGNADQHNIIVAKQVAMMIGALAIVDEEPAAAKYVKQAFDYIHAYLDARVESEETEGLMYNNIAATHLAQAAAAFKKSTGHAELMEHPFLTVFVPDQFFYFQSAGNQPTFANLSDCHPKLNLAYMMSMLAENASNGAAMWYVQQYESNSLTVLLNVVRGTEAIPPERYFAGRMSKAFPRIGWVALRSGWGERDHVMAFTSSPSARGHNHLDQNHFILNVAGEWLIADPGYQDYRPGPKNEFTDGSVGHNVLLVNGQGQRLRGGGRLTSSHMSPGFDAVRGDATASYEGAIRHWYRTVAHMDESCFIIIDDIALHDASDRAELLLHAKDGIVISEAGDGGAYTFSGERASVLVCTSSSHGASSMITEYPGAEEYGPYLVYQVNADPKGRARFATLLVPRPELESIENEPCEWHVEWREEGSVITINGRDRLRIWNHGGMEWVRESAPNGMPEAYALFAGQSLLADDKELLSFSLPASGSVRHDRDVYTIALTLPAATQVKLMLPAISSIQDQSGSEVQAMIVEEGRILMDLPAGEHRLIATLS